MRCVVIRQGRVVVFSKPACRHCKAAKFTLEQLGVRWHEVDVAEFPDRVEEMQERSGRSTVPQVPVLPSSRAAVVASPVVHTTGNLSYEML